MIYRIPLSSLEGHQNNYRARLPDIVCAALERAGVHAVSVLDYAETKQRSGSAVLTLADFRITGYPAEITLTYECSECDSVGGRFVDEKCFLSIETRDEHIITTTRVDFSPDEAEAVISRALTHLSSLIRFQKLAVEPISGCFRSLA